MKQRFTRIAFAFLFGFCGVAWADLRSSPVVFKSGNWSVLRSTDAMTDKVSCTGIYKDDRSIQLSSDTLYITVQGGIESVTLRFGEQPPERLRLASDIEKKVQAIFVSGSEFSKLLGSNRLRIRSLTLVRDIANFDLDLTGLNDAVQNIRNGCPGDPQSPSAGASMPSLCNDVVMARLRERQVPQDDIAYICSP